VIIKELEGHLKEYLRFKFKGTRKEKEKEFNNNSY
jgi:hypothetical protein